MKVCLDLHDFSVVNNRLLWLLTLKDQFPLLKVSLFTVPVDEQRDWGPYLVRNDYLTELKKHLNWIQLIPHGYTHNGREVQKMNYDEFGKYWKDIETAFRKDGLPYEKGFCAPHWGWNKDVVKYLDDNNMWGAVDRRQPDMLKPKRFYEYSHCLDDKWDMESDMKLHGHIYGTQNDLAKNFDKLLTFPIDTNWRYVTDFLVQVQ